MTAAAAPPVRYAAVLGSPVAHSLSPALHNAAYRDLGLPWTYTARDCLAVDLPGLVAALRADPAWVGLSLTMPLKEVGLGVADEVSPLARRAGAVNTLTFADGRVTADNTDVEGVAAALAGLPADGAVLLLGAGGTARAVVLALADRPGRRLTVATRDRGRARAALELAADSGLDVAWAAWPPALPASGLVVNTTPAGVADGLAAGRWPAALGLLDVLYAPWPTALARAATAAGAPVVGGLEVLLHQAVGQVRRWTGRVPGLAAMRQAADAELARRAQEGGSSG